MLQVPHSRLNGHPTLRLPQNANVSFRFVEGESMLLHLDMRGFAVSTGSACFSRSLEASHVILGIGGDHERAHGSVRFTFGRFNQDEDVDAVRRTRRGRDGMCSQPWEMRAGSSQPVGGKE